MKATTQMFVIGFVSSFTAGLALVYLYNKWSKQGTLPLANVISTDNNNKYELRYYI